MCEPLAILKLLADGCFHSGETLAARLGISRELVRRNLRGLERYGLYVRAVPGKGYRLCAPIECLDGDAIVCKLTPAVRGLLVRFDLYQEVRSTNEVLLERSADGGAHGHVCLAEFQTAGRGRRGHRWVQPFGAGICLSLAWRFELVSPALTALGLAAGVAVLRALRCLGITGAGLKWPNDLVWVDRKLGGLLIETRGSAHALYDVVIGVGLNVAFPRILSEPIDQSWTDLASVCGRVVSRNELAASLICALLETLSAREPLSALREEWGAYDVLRGRRVRMSSASGEVRGEALGVDADGALLVAVDGRVRRYLSADVSPRIAE